MASSEGPLPQLATLLDSSLLILHRSQWRCLANSYSAVKKSLNVLWERACFLLGPIQLESMWRKLAGPLDALDQAERDGEACLRDLLPTSCASKHYWLLEKAMKVGMSTEVVDLHLNRLLWISSVVREQILMCAPIDGMEAFLLEHTRELCEIWSHVDAENDLLSAQSFLKGIIMGEEKGETCQLARFILQKLSCSELSASREMDALPPFLWVDPKDLTKSAEIVGEGGHGLVQEGVWLGGRFAVKDFFYIEDDVAFGREASIQARLQHPNVMQLICCTKNPRSKKCSLVMEIMQHDLRVFLMQRTEFAANAKTPLPLSLGIDLMLQISQGMEYLHSERLHIMHRDLKSSNVLVSFSNNSHANDMLPHVHVKVADFGMSKAKSASSRYSTRPVGTFHWRAPEVFKVGLEDVTSKGYAKYTEKADVYSFAIVCYEILTGKFPWGEETPPEEIEKKVLAGERPSLPRDCPPALSSFIEQCWHADPKQRPGFTQICGMLRYFKACIFLQDQYKHNAQEYHSWLLHPLPIRTCDRIDNMLQRSLLPFVHILQPRLLAIPLEMYCCRAVLQQCRDKIQVSSKVSGLERGNGIGVLVAEGESRHNGQLDKQRRPTQGYLSRFSNRWQMRRSWNSYSPKVVYWGPIHPIEAGLVRTLANLGIAKFTYEELRGATFNFSTRIKGENPASGVYVGKLRGQAIAVKVTRYKRYVGIERRLLENILYYAERLQMQQRNIVQLLGWCLDVGKIIFFVYEYMPNGDLAQHIFDSRGRVVFEWQRRYKVLQQVAAALQSLHDKGFSVRGLRVKPSKILLDSELNAKLAGCCQALLAAQDVETRYQNYHGSADEDVYSFGVMVLEIATGRLDYTLEDSLSVWVGNLFISGELMQAADVRLAGKFNELEMMRVLKLGLVCTQHHQPEARRPSMLEVQKMLIPDNGPLLLEEYLYRAFWSKES